jgi:hypothetical protein
MQTPSGVRRHLAANSPATWHFRLRQAPSSACRSSKTLDGNRTSSASRIGRTAAEVSVSSPASGRHVSPNDAGDRAEHDDADVADRQRKPAAIDRLRRRQGPPVAYRIVPVRAWSLE